MSNLTTLILTAVTVVMFVVSLDNALQKGDDIYLNSLAQQTVTL